MGNNTISQATDGNVIPASDHNSIREAIIGNFTPRNTSGVVQDGFGSLGEADKKWLKAFIESGYFSAGDIKAHHTYNGTVPVGQGWYPCNNTIINETNYDAIHGAGSWATYIGSSLLDGKYSPNLIQGYVRGVSNTIKDGTTPITNVGNTSNSTSISHHHRWVVGSFVGTNTAQQHLIKTDLPESFGGAGYFRNTSWNSAGASVELNTLDYGATSDYQMLDDNYTESGGGSIDVSPNSLEAIYYVRII